jgi:hypothetical protein
MALRVRYDPDTREITSVGTPGHDFPLHAFDLEAAEIVDATVERQRKGGRPAAIKLANDTIVEEIWPPPNNYLYEGGPEP